jgi:hypothetical protein
VDTNSTDASYSSSLKNCSKQKDKGAKPGKLQINLGSSEYREIGKKIAFVLSLFKVLSLKQTCAYIDVSVLIYLLNFISCILLLARS